MSLYPLSWSKIDAYNTCPKQYHGTRVTKQWAQGETEAMIWGNEVHAAFEQNTLTGAPLVGRFEKYAPLAAKVAAIPGTHFAEQRLAIDIDGKPVEYDSVYAYARSIIDHLVTRIVEAINIDWKTGKRKPYSRQLDMSGSIVLAHYPDIEVVHNAYVWTQGGKPSRKTITREDVPAIWSGFAKDIERMEWSYTHDAWPAQPSGLCRNYCPVLDCIHNGRRK